MTLTEDQVRAIEDRLLRIETRLDLFATKEDVQRAKVELVQWMAGLAITIILFVVGFGLTILARLPVSAS